MELQAEPAVVQLVIDLIPISSTLDNVDIRVIPHSGASDTWRRVEIPAGVEWRKAAAASALIADVFLRDASYAALLDWGGGDVVLQLDSPKQDEGAESIAQRILTAIRSGAAVVEHAPR